MPIKPENKVRYPKDWKDIRAKILARARYKCEEPACALGNGWIGYRDDDGKFMLLSTSGRADDYAGHATGYRVFRVVLTIAHLDHVPEHCDESNLRAWCQRCHLRYDAAHHAFNSAQTRRARKNTIDMFEVAVS